MSHKMKRVREVIHIFVNIMSVHAIGILGGETSYELGPISWLCLPPNSALTNTIPRLRASAEFLR